MATIQIESERLQAIMDLLYSYHRDLSKYYWLKRDVTSEKEGSNELSIYVEELLFAARSTDHTVDYMRLREAVQEQFTRGSIATQKQAEQLASRMWKELGHGLHSFRVNIKHGIVSVHLIVPVIDSEKKVVNL